MSERDMEKIYLFTKKMRKIAVKTGHKAEEIYRLSLLKMNIMNKHAEIQEKYEELGRCLYIMYKNDVDDTPRLQRLIADIDNAYQTAEESRRRIAQIHSLVECRECGAPSKTSANYCAGCGRRLVATDEVPDGF